MIVALAESVGLTAALAFACVGFVRFLCREDIAEERKFKRNHHIAEMEAECGIEVAE